MKEEHDLEIYATIGRRRRSMRRTGEELDYDPYESVNCKSEKVIKGSEVKHHVKCESNESKEEIYESLGKLTDIRSSSSETSSTSEENVKNASTESTPEKNSCDLYAKVKKISSVSNDPNSDFVSIYPQTKDEFNSKEESKIEVAVFDKNKREEKSASQFPSKNYLNESSSEQKSKDGFPLDFSAKRKSEFQQLSIFHNEFESHNT